MGQRRKCLVGDFLHSRAFELMVELGNIDVMALISKATNGIAEGEVQQLTLLQNTSTSEADYLEVIYRKTALLFEVSAESGAVLGGANASEAAAYREYGRHLGLRSSSWMIGWITRARLKSSVKILEMTSQRAKSRYQSFSPSKQLAHRTDESSSRPSPSQDQLLLRTFAASPKDMVA